MWNHSFLHEDAQLVFRNYSPGMGIHLKSLTIPCHLGRMELLMPIIIL